MEIFYWNGLIIQQITDNSLLDYSVSLYNGTIAWTGDDGSGNGEIFYAYQLDETIAVPEPGMLVMFGLWAGVLSLLRSRCRVWHGGRTTIRG